MSHADIEDLAALALDGSEGESAPAARDHVADCADCAALVESLADVRRLAGAEPLVAPPDALRARVLAEAFDDADEPGVQDDARPSALQDDLGARRSRPSQLRGVPLWAAGLAAAAALVVGAVLGNVIGQDATPAPDRADVLASAELTTVEGSEPRGDARVEKSGGVVTVHVEAASLEEADLREVWLLNVDGTRMVSLGFLGEGDEGDFDVPARLLEEGYRILDISVEPDDGDPTHSGVSVARGELV